jgi:hypothetical protein
MHGCFMDWVVCNLSALPGTGYISGGPAIDVVDPHLGTSTSFIERIPHSAAVYQADVLVLDGGRNDVFAQVKDVFKAMTAMIEEASQVWPTAKIAFISWDTTTSSSHDFESAARR